MMKAQWFWLVLMALVLLSPTSVSAQERGHHTPHSVLAQTCLHEASIPVRATREDGTEFWARIRDRSIEWGADCWIIHEVFLVGAARLARGRYEESLSDPSFARLYVAFALAHSEGVFNPIERDTNRWARDVHPPFAQPEGWRRSVSECVDGICRIVQRGSSWERQRGGAMYAWELAGTIVENGLDTVHRWTVCSETPDTWGGDLDSDHAQRMGFVEVMCDPSANTAYAYPSQIRARAARTASQ